MNEKDRMRRESSIPITTRVSMLDLAKMDRYWLSEGTQMKTMSQLVSWSISALVDLLDTHGLIPEGIETVLDAHQYLESRMLYQRGSKTRAKSRITAAIGIENLRLQGKDPSYHHKTAYDTIHSRHAITPVNKEIPINKGWDEDTQRKIDEANKQDMEDSIERSKKQAREIPGLCVGSEAELISEEGLEQVGKKGGEINKCGMYKEYIGMSPEQFHKRLAEKDEPYLKELNKPVEELKFDIVDK